MKKMTITEMKRLNKENGGCYFSKESMSMLGLIITMLGNSWMSKVKITAICFHLSHSVFLSRMSKYSWGMQAISIGLRITNLEAVQFM